MELKILIKKTNGIIKKNLKNTGILLLILVLVSLLSIVLPSLGFVISLLAGLFVGLGFIIISKTEYDGIQFSNYKELFLEILGNLEIALKILLIEIFIGFLGVVGIIIAFFSKYIPDFIKGNQDKVIKSLENDVLLILILGIIIGVLSIFISFALHYEVIYGNKAFESIKNSIKVVKNSFLVVFFYNIKIVMAGVGLAIIVGLLSFGSDLILNLFVNIITVYYGIMTSVFFMELTSYEKIKCDEDGESDIL